MKNGGQREEGAGLSHMRLKWYDKQQIKKAQRHKKMYSFIVLEKKQKEVEKRDNLRFYLHSESTASCSPPSCPVHWGALWELCYRVFTRWWCVSPELR